MKKYPSDSIESWAIFFVDTGSTLSSIKNSLLNGDSCPGFAEEDIDQVLTEMIEDTVLAHGTMYGNDDWLVVREWMPNMAAKLDNPFDEELL